MRFFTKVNCVYQARLFEFIYYPVKGCPELSEHVVALLGERVEAGDQWGIDHGTWTVLMHMFPDASIPVVQLSVDATIDAREALEIGRKLIALREEGYLIFGSGQRRYGGELQEDSVCALRRAHSRALSATDLLPRRSRRRLPGRIQPTRSTGCHPNPPISCDTARRPT